jgi:hypothetical protein
VIQMISTTVTAESTTTAIAMGTILSMGAIVGQNPSPSTAHGAVL